MRKSMFAVLLALCLGLWAATAWGFSASTFIHVSNNDSKSHQFTLEGEGLFLSRPMDAYTYYEYEVRDTAYFFYPKQYEYNFSVFDGSSESPICNAQITVNTIMISPFPKVTTCYVSSFDARCGYSYGVYGFSCQVQATILP